MTHDTVPLRWAQRSGRDDAAMPVIPWMLIVMLQVWQASALTTTIPPFPISLLGSAKGVPADHPLTKTRTKGGKTMSKAACKL